MMTAGINEDEVPFEEGFVKLRGFPATVTKADMVGFLKVRVGGRVGPGRGGGGGGGRPPPGPPGSGWR
jgi:hypothetical protein